MQTLASLKTEGFPGHVDDLSHCADKMHFDTTEFAVEKSAMYEAVGLKMCVQLCCEPVEKIEVELSSDARCIVICSLKNGWVLDQIDSNHYPTSWR